MEIEQIGGLLFFVGLILALSYSWVLLTKGKQNKENRFVSTFLVFLYCTSWLVFVLNLLSSSFQYDVPIDPVDNVFMKPLEWIFLIVIYSVSKNPEKLINEQYK